MANVTESRHPEALGIDLLDDAEVLRILHRAQVAAAACVEAAIPQLARASEAMAAAIRGEGRIVYAAAGSSGLMGMADGLELTPTFGIPIERIRILRAGGLEDMARPKGHAEDNVEAARADAADIAAADCVICIAASGTTTYPLEIMRLARGRGAVTVGMACNDGTPLLAESDIPVLLPTPPEVVAGSTRLGAGTAQKIALNMMSTLMGVRLGHVVDGLMVNVIANNAKLVRRSVEIVKAVSGCDEATAEASLAATSGKVKEAILVARGANGLSDARARLDRAEGQLRKALSELE